MGMTYIPEEQYQKIISQVPIFCADFLVRCGDEYLLLRRENEPLKGTYWPAGGRLMFKETLEEFAYRVQMREMGKHLPDFKLIGFSNYFFPDVKDKRATHTPTMLYLVEVDEKFDPELHEAVTMVPMPDKKSNTVLEVIQTGFTLNGRLVRPALVIVVQ